MILACQNVVKSFGTQLLLEDTSFHIEEREKAAIVGINGAGKTTLLKMILGQEPADQGEIILAKGTKAGYLAQHQQMLPDATIYEELLTVKGRVIELEEKLRSAEARMKHCQGQQLEELMEQYARLNHAFEQEDGYAYKSQIIGVLKGLGFSEEDFSKKTAYLSGGQKTRVSLAKLLLDKPDLLLLDEPTNHLDLASITWLETYLQNYDGAVLLISHDRYFIDKVATKIIELENTHCYVYRGNYEAYLEKRARRREAQLQAYLNQQAEIRHQEEVIAKLRSFNREKSIKRAESREKMLEKIVPEEKPADVRADMNLSFSADVKSGNDVLQVEQLTKAYGSQQLFSHVSFEIKRGERVAVIGGNGTGKTTLLKIINGLEQPDEGSVTLGTKVTIGYYDQEYHVLHTEKTIYEEISDTYPHLTQTEIRNVLAAFLFTGDEVFAPISTLSGGERGRVSLAKLMLSGANFLILDEPTNHLDIISKEVLEQALNDYEGTVLYVSHDRYFINKTAGKILELTGQTLIPYLGNYDYYLEKKEELTAVYAPAPAPGEEQKESSENKLSWQQQKEQQARQRKKENQLKQVESRIDQLEKRIAGLDGEMALPENAADASKLMELAAERGTCETELEQLLEKWESLS